MKKKGAAKLKPYLSKRDREPKDVRLGLIPYAAYERPKKHKNLTNTQWAESVFKPDPKYKKPYPRWIFYARIKVYGTAYKPRYICDMLMAYDKVAAEKQANKLAKLRGGELLRLWRDRPVNWAGYNVPWNLNNRKGSKK